MPLTTVIPIITSIATVLAGLTIASLDLSRWRGSWVIPAATSLVFLLFSTVAVVVEGPLGFWSVHTQSLWGNQVWIDLLMAALVAFAAIAPRARALGIRLVPWFMLIIATGSIGLLALAARVLFLRDHAPHRGIA